MLCSCFPNYAFRFPSSKRRKRHANHGQMHTLPTEDGLTGTGGAYRYRAAAANALQTADSESGVYYLVPNRYGTGKTVVRRQPAPPPLDDGFDAEITTRAGPSQRVRPSPLPDQPRGNNVNKPTIATPQKPPRALTTTTPAKNTHAHTLPRLPPKETRPTSGGGGAATVRSGGTFDTGYGEYGHYMTELERKFGGAPDLTLSPTRSRGRGVVVPAPTPAPQIPLRRVTPNTSPNTANANVGISGPLKLGTVGRPVQVGGSGQLRTRHSFEIVDRRILEDGPERTVTISTWREQVADQADADANMDIFYLDARDYAEGEQGGSDDDDDDALGLMMRSVSEAESSDADVIRKRRRTLPPRPREEQPVPIAQVASVGTIRTIADEEMEESPEVRLIPVIEDEIEDRTSAIQRPAAPSSSSSSSSSSTSSSSRKSSKKSSHSNSSKQKSDGSDDVDPASWHPTPPQTPPQEPRTQNRGAGQNKARPPQTNNASRPKINGIGSSSSTPPPPSTPPPDPARMQRTHTPIRSSTPNRRTYINNRRNSASTSSFRPTQSGSTITTIKSASVVAFENILGSCDPPLSHISPALAQLGIVNDGHLRAIARLSDETRDREIKEEALRQGISVVEWAILLDKMHSL